MNRISAMYSHRRLDDGSSVDQSLPHRYLTGREMPAIFATNPPVERPATSRRHDQPAGINGRSVR